MSRAFYEIDVKVIDLADLRAHALSLNDSLDDDSAVEELVEEVASNARVAPLDAGYEIMRASVVAVASDLYRARIEAEVFDGAALVAAAIDSHGKAWSEPGWEPADLGEALYEQSYASNASPCASEIGIEVRGSSHAGDPVPSPSANAPA